MAHSRNKPSGVKRSVYRGRKLHKGGSLLRKKETARK